MSSDIKNHHLAVTSLVIITIVVLAGTMLTKGLYQRRLAQAESVDNVKLADALQRVLIKAQARDLGPVTQPSFERMSYHEIIAQCARVRPNDLAHADLQILDHMICQFEDWHVPRLDVYVVQATGYKPGIKMLLVLEGRSALRLLSIIEHHESLDFGTVLLATNSDWLTFLLDKTLPFFQTPPQNTELDMISGATITAQTVRRSIATLMQEILIESHDNE